MCGYSYAIHMYERARTLKRRNYIKFLFNFPTSNTFVVLAGARAHYSFIAGDCTYLSDGVSRIAINRAIMSAVCAVSLCLLKMCALYVCVCL